MTGVVNFLPRKTGIVSPRDAVHNNAWPPDAEICTEPDPQRSPLTGVGEGLTGFMNRFFDWGFPVYAGLVEINLILYAFPIGRFDGRVSLMF